MKGPVVKRTKPRKTTIRFTKYLVVILNQVALNQLGLRYVFLQESLQININISKP